MRDKLFLPMGEGAIVANYLDPSLQIGGGNEIDVPSSHTQCLQWWGAYYTSPAPPQTLLYEHDLSGSQLLFFGSYDFQGWAKAIWVTNVAGPAPALLWEGGCIPPDDMKLSTGNLSYTSWANGLGVQWAIGALPTGSDWGSLCRYYRSEFLYVPWSYEGEVPPKTIAQQLSGAGALSTKLVNAGTFAEYEQPYSPCQYSWAGAVKEDIDGIREVLVNNIGPSPTSPRPFSRTAATSYHHVIERNLLTEGLDKLVDMPNLCGSLVLPPNMQPTWIPEIQRLNNNSEFSAAFYSFGMYWDVTSLTWCGTAGGCVPGHPLSAPPNLSTCPPLGANCYNSSVGSCFPTGGLPYLKHSYLVNEFQKCVVGAPPDCTDLMTMCPDSTQEYHDTFWAAIAEHARELNAAGGLSCLDGTYVDNMGGRPLCYYQQSTSSTPTLPFPGYQHLHSTNNGNTTGGGRYFCAGRRKQFRDIRLGSRASTQEPNFYTMSEFPAEQWLGVVDARGSYLASGDGGDVYAGNSNPLSTLTNLPISGTPVSSMITPLPFRVTSVPAFQMVYGDNLLTYEIGHHAPEEFLFTKSLATQQVVNLPQSAVAGLVHPVDAPPAGLGTTVLMGYNAYGIAAANSPNVVDINAYAASNPTAYNGFNYAAALQATYTGWQGRSQIGEFGAATVPQVWTNTLWGSATTFLCAMDFVLQFQAPDGWLMG